MMNLYCGKKNIMKTKSKKPKGQRMLKSVSYINPYRNNIKTKRPLWIETVERGFWFDPDKLEWVKNPKNMCGLHSSYYAMGHRGLPNPMSLKAAKRLIYKWKAPKGTEFKVSLPFVGFDFIVKKS